MNKKIAAMVTSLTVGGVLLFGTVFANASELSGYEAYKSAVKATKDLKDETAALNVSILDNGNTKAKLNSDVKLNLGSSKESSVTTITEGTSTQTFASYMQDGKSISKDNNSDQYLVKTINEKKLNKVKRVENPTVIKSIEVIVDTLVGNMKNNVVTADNADGTKNISINLSQNEVTPLVNALASIGLSENNTGKNHNDKKDLGSLKDAIPQLQSDIAVKSVTSEGTINKDGIITNQTAKIVIDGKDAQGTQHEISFNVDLKLSNINSTTPDKVDLTGKQVKDITSMRKDKER